MNIRKLGIMISICFFTTSSLATPTSTNHCIKDIGNHASTYSLELQYCDLQDEDMPIVSAFLHMNPKISFLDLTYNGSITENGYSALAQNKTLKSLSVAGDYHSYIQESVIIAIAKISSLEYIDFTSTDFRISTSPFAALAKLPHLSELRLGNTLINDKYVTQLANAFANNKSLEWLDLSSNQISLKGVRALVNLKHLKHLNLANNVIRDEGVIELVTNSTISDLNLSGNGIGDKGAAALAKNWKPKTLDGNADLDLSKNNITDQGALEFVTNQIPAMVRLDLCFNLHSNEAKIALNNIQNIDLWYSDECDDDETSVAKHLAANASFSKFKPFKDRYKK